MKLNVQLDAIMNKVDKYNDKQRSNLIVCIILLQLKLKNTKQTTLLKAKNNFFK